MQEDGEFWALVLRRFLWLAFGHVRVLLINRCRGVLNVASSLSLGMTSDGDVQAMKGAGGVRVDGGCSNAPSDWKDEVAWKNGIRQNEMCESR